MDDDQRVAAEHKASQERELQRRSDFLAIMGTSQGRRFIWKLMGESCLFLPIYSPDHSQMAFNEGRRQIGLKLLTDCNTLCPNLYLTMMKENTQPTEATKHE